MHKIKFEITIEEDGVSQAEEWMSLSFPEYLNGYIMGSLVAIEMSVVSQFGITNKSPFKAGDVLHFEFQDIESSYEEGIFTVIYTIETVGKFNRIADEDTVTEIVTEAFTHFISTKTSI